MSNIDQYHGALVDAILTQGRRYGLTSNYRAHFLQIVQSVPLPCEKPTTGSPELDRALAYERACEDGALSRDVALQTLGVTEAGVTHADGSKSGDTSVTTAPSGEIPSAPTPGVPSDEQILAAVQATADKPAEVLPPAPPVTAEANPVAEKTGVDHYNETRTPPVGFSITGVGNDRGVK